jgi:hypothetical protein
MLEIYNENIKDLLSSKKDDGDEKLMVRQGEHGMYVAGERGTPLTEMPATSLEEVLFDERVCSTCCAPVRWPLMLYLLCRSCCTPKMYTACNRKLDHLLDHLCTTCWTTCAPLVHHLLHHLCTTCAPLAHSSPKLAARTLTRSLTTTHCSSFTLNWLLFYTVLIVLILTTVLTLYSHCTH